MVCRLYDCSFDVQPANEIQEEQRLAEEKKATKMEEIARMPPIDVSSLDLQQLQPLEKDDVDFGAAKVWQRRPTCMSC